ncbi:MAG TPA: hypothetical protein VKH18_16910 [Terriglobales bacterium]|nr:hypothetical protein [Terriglobales bacterium]
MRQFARVWLLVVLVSTIGVAQTTDDAVVVPGVRCGRFILGRTRENEIESIRDKKAGIDFQFTQDHLLKGVVVTTSDFRTDRQIRVGDSEEDVLRAYGKGKTGNIDLTKGTTADGRPVVVGKVGDKVLFYPGIEFVFSKQRVWAIILVPKS